MQPTCLWHHSMTINVFADEEGKRRYRRCDICNKAGETEDFPTCLKCKFDMCLACLKLPRATQIKEWNEYHPNYQVDPKEALINKQTVKASSPSKEFHKTKNLIQKRTASYTKPSYSPPKKAKSPHKSRGLCPASHQLQYGRSANSIVTCNKCQRATPPAQTFFCSICDYDACNKCMGVTV